MRLLLAAGVWDPSVTKHSEAFVPCCPGSCSLADGLSPCSPCYLIPQATSLREARVLCAAHGGICLLMSRRGESLNKPADDGDAGDTAPPHAPLRAASLGWGERLLGTGPDGLWLSSGSPHDTWRRVQAGTGNSSDMKNLWAISSGSVSSGEVCSLALDAEGTVWQLDHPPGHGPPRTASSGEGGSPPPAPPPATRAPPAASSDPSPPSPIPRELPLPISVRQVCCGAMHCIAVAADGCVFSWGWNGLGATGQGRQESVDVSSPTLISSLAGAIKIVQAAAGLSHTLLLSDSGDVYSCGWNGDGQLGLGDTAIRTEPTLCESITSTISKISCGGRHSLALSQGGRELLVWGWGKWGQLGLPGAPTSLSQPQPTQLPRGRVMDVEGGRWHTLISMEEIDDDDTK